MRFNKLTKVLFASGGALLLTATAAGAHDTHTYTFTPSSTALSANADYASHTVFGAVEVNTMTVDLEAGFKLAHDDQKGNELNSNPNDEEVVGEGEAKANWNVPLFGCSVSVQTVTVTWEEDMTGAPTGAVAHYVLNHWLGDTDVWLVEEDDATDDYKLTLDLDESKTCSSQPSDAYSDLTTYGVTSNGREVSRNPSTDSCKTVTATFVDTSSTTHSGTVDQAFGSGTCPD